MDIEKIIQGRIEDIDVEAIVRDIVTDLIRAEAQKQVKRITDEKATELIVTAIKSVLYRGEVKTNDGWGKTETYPNFEALFKCVLHKKLAVSWDMQGLVKKVIEEKVAQLVYASKAQLAKRFTDELVAAVDKE